MVNSERGDAIDILHICIDHALARLGKDKLWRIHIQVVDAYWRSLVNTCERLASSSNILFFIPCRLTLVIDELSCHTFKVMVLDSVLDFFVSSSSERETSPTTMGLSREVFLKSTWCGFVSVTSASSKMLFFVVFESENGL